MQRIYGPHFVIGRGRLLNVNDEAADPWINSDALSLPEFPTNHADGFLWLQPTPPRPDLPLWRQLNISPDSIGGRACTGRSILSLTFEPGSMIERGSLRVAIWTDLYDQVRKAIVGSPKEFELSFTVSSYGDKFGEWAYGDYGRGSADRLGAQTLIFGHGHFSLRRLTFEVGQTPRLIDAA